MTTKELFDKYESYYSDSNGEFYGWFVDEEDFTKALKEFAEYHVRKALESAIENVKTGKEGFMGVYWNQSDIIVDNDSILNSYSSDKII